MTVDVRTQCTQAISKYLERTPWVVGYLFNLLI